MPNGHREPYRYQVDGDPPSPAHSSDTEVTREEKLRFHAIQRQIIVLWISTVLWKRRLIPGKLRVALVVRRIAAYLPENSCLHNE